MWNRILIVPGVVSIFAALALAACGDKEPTYNVNQPGQGLKKKIDINIGFAAGAATRVAVDEEFVCEWEVGDAVGLFAVEHGAGIGAVGSAGNYIDNVELTYKGDGMWEAAENLFWPDDGGALDFFAYYPFDPGFDPTDSNLAVPADQSEGWAMYDLMTAENNGDGAGLTSGTTVTLDFEHIMAMVQLTLDVSMPSNAPSGPPVVTLQGMTPEKITMHCTEIPPGGGTYVCRAIVKPQSVVAGTRMFRIEFAGGRVFMSDPITEPLELIGGEVEIFPLDLSGGP